MAKRNTTFPLLHLFSERGQAFCLRKPESGMVTQSEESMTLMTSCGVLSIYFITAADPSLAFRMTLYC
ncbi:MAG: hypothetical protein ACLRZN_04840 [Dialister invisus]